jgi:ferric-dicitrate binding protein FerR (iron transport regulator)
VRIDVASVVRLEAARLVALERGALDVDAGPAAAPGDAIEVATPLGSVRHLGTQFEVRLLGGGEQGEPAGAVALRVRVREGAVLVARAGRSYEARAGGEITVHADGRADHLAAPVQGSSWDWVQRTAPPLDVDGESLGVFLDWVSRETGLQWRFSEPGLARAAREVVLHGTIEGLTPEEALSVVLPGCGLRHRRLEGALLLEPGAER